MINGRAAPKKPPKDGIALSTATLREGSHVYISRVLLKGNPTLEITLDISKKPPKDGFALSTAT